MSNQNRLSKQLYTKLSITIICVLLFGCANSPKVQLADGANSQHPPAASGFCTTSNYWIFEWNNYYIDWNGYGNQSPRTRKPIITSSSTEHRTCKYLQRSRGVYMPATRGLLKKNTVQHAISHYKDVLVTYEGKLCKPEPHIVFHINGDTRTDSQIIEHSIDTIFNRRDFFKNTDKALAFKRMKASSGFYINPTTKEYDEVREYISSFKGRPDFGKFYKHYGFLPFFYDPIIDLVEFQCGKKPKKIHLTAVNDPVYNKVNRPVSTIYTGYLDISGGSKKTVHGNTGNARAMKRLIMTEVDILNARYLKNQERLARKRYQDQQNAKALTTFLLMYFGGYDGGCYGPNATYELDWHCENRESLPSLKDK